MAHRLELAWKRKSCGYRRGDDGSQEDSGLAVGTVKQEECAGFTSGRSLNSVGFDER